MYTDEYYEMLKLRAVFVISVGVYIECGDNGYELETIDNTIQKLYILANEKLRENCAKYYPLFSKIIPHVNDKKVTYIYENEKTINDLIDFVACINSVEMFNVLMEDLDPKDFNNSVQLAKLYCDHYYPNDLGYTK